MERGSTIVLPERTEATKEMPETRWSDFKKTSSMVTREAVEGSGPHIVLADGREVCVVLSVGNYLELIVANPKPIVEMRRIEGQMWFKYNR